MHKSGVQDNVNLFAFLISLWLYHPILPMLPDGLVIRSSFCKIANFEMYIQNQINMNNFDSHQ